MLAQPKSVVLQARPGTAAKCCAILRKAIRQSTQCAAGNSYSRTHNRHSRT